MIKGTHQPSARTRKLTLRQLADQVTKDDGTSIGPPYLNDIGLHHRIPTPHILRARVRVLDLNYDTLLTLAGAADIVVQEYMEAHSQHSEIVIRLFRAGWQQGFHGRDHLHQRIKRRRSVDR